MPIHKQRLNRALEFLNLKPGQKIADLGSGDGRVLIEAAKKGAVAIGYEINPFLVLKAKMEIKKQGFSKLAFCKWQSFWKMNFGDFDIVFIFGINHIMKAIEKKAQKEMKPGSKIVCFVFPLPNWQPIFAENGVYIYPHTKQGVVAEGAKNEVSPCCGVGVYEKR